MHPNVAESPHIPYQYIGSKHYHFDLIYNPEETAFLQKGREQGALTENGMDMLIIQAEESWKIWNKL
jgi:shikimate dehydrogenase